jgi:hypothetical protein
VFGAPTQFLASKSRAVAYSLQHQRRQLLLTHLLLPPSTSSPTWAVCFLSLLELRSSSPPTSFWCCPCSSFSLFPPESAFFFSRFASFARLAQVTSATLLSSSFSFAPLLRSAPSFFFHSPVARRFALVVCRRVMAPRTSCLTLPSLSGVLILGRRQNLFRRCATLVDRS